MNDLKQAESDTMKRLLAQSPELRRTRTNPVQQLDEDPHIDASVLAEANARHDREHGDALIWERGWHRPRRRR